MRFGDAGSKVVAGACCFYARGAAFKNQRVMEAPSDSAAQSLTGDRPPLADYEERLFEVRRRFELYDECVIVRARWWNGQRFEHKVALADLTGEMRETVVRYRIFRYAGWILAVGALVFAACRYYGTHLDWLQAVGYVALAIAIVGMLVMAATYRNRRIRFARFPNRQGRIALDVSEAGNEASTFESFVNQIRRRIPR